jgi:hypothetical protein
MSRVADTIKEAINLNDEEEVNLDFYNRNTSHLCEHLFADGAFCKMVAPKGEQFCHWHATAEDREERRYKYEKRRSKTAIKGLIIQTIEDSYSLQLAIHEVMDAIIDGRADRTRAAQLLYALQISQNNIKGHFRFPRIRFNEFHLESLLEEQLKEEGKEKAERETLGKKPPQSITVATSESEAIG